MESLEKLNIII